MDSTRISRADYAKRLAVMINQAPALIDSDISRKAFRKNYLIDADRTTLSFDPEALEGRLSTGYPIETYL
jgi:hypothetical protein